MTLKHVLVVDDQPNWRKALRFLLENERVHVSEAENSDEAKEILKHSKFDLAVFDVRLVDEETFNVEGLELLYLIKQTDPVTKTIVMTGYPESIRGKIEADEFILKVPQNSTFSREFLEKVKRLLEN